MIENINLIRKIAWSFHTTTGHSWDDLFQEGMIAYLKAIKTHDPKRGALSTYVWHCVESHLKNYLRLEREYKAPLCDLEELRKHATCETPVWESLSARAQKAVNMILDNPERLLALPPILAEQMIRKILFENNWTSEEVRKAMKELRQVYS